MKIFENYPLKEMSHIKIGGTAKQLIEIEHSSELESLDTENCIVIGKGSNMLIPDDFIDKTFISLQKLCEIRQLDETRFYVEAGVRLSKLLTVKSKANVSVLEVLACVPATVGGLIYMNAGANGICVFDFIESVTVFDKGRLETISRDKIDFAYRHTMFQHTNAIIVSAVFNFQKEDYKHAIAMQSASEKNIKQPLTYPNLGSVFKNPTGFAAWRLIDTVGLRGHQIGGAMFSTKHSNFIINIGEARFDDVIELIELAKNRVYNQFSIQLEEEIIIIL
jgi:UDP-N-acetylmuramate dehydrogenase